MTAGDTRVTRGPVGARVVRPAIEPPTGLGTAVSRGGGALLCHSDDDPFTPRVRRAAEVRVSAPLVSSEVRRWPTSPCPHFLCLS